MGTLVVGPVFRRRATLLAAALGLALAPHRLHAQFVDPRFVAIDMYGGPVWASGSELGVAFGARFGFADVFERALHMGLELDWWTAARQGADLEVRDALVGLSFWRDVTKSAVMRPFLGFAAALHSLDTSRKDGSRFADGGSLEARKLDGLKFGVSGFGGLTLRLSQTGAIWLIAEYRYTIVSSLSNHELRAGLRLRGSDP